MTDNPERLPREAADRVTQPRARFLKIETASGGFLLLAVLVAMAMANSPWGDAYLPFWETPIGLTFGARDFTRSLRHWINDGLMTLFFFVISLELKRAIILGELRHPRMAALPFAAALGGMTVPVTLYLALMLGEPGQHGWGTVMATDTAFVIACLALFGTRIPPSLRLFLLSLAISDDVGAVLVVAFIYGEALNWIALGRGALGLGVVSGAAQLGARRIPVYFLMVGAIWLCIDASHPRDHRGRHPRADDTDPRLGQRHASARHSRGFARLSGRGALERRHRRPPRPAPRRTGGAGIAVFRRAAGDVAAPLRGRRHHADLCAGQRRDHDRGHGFRTAVSLAIIVGLELGKPIWVVGFSWLAVRPGLARRGSGLTWPFLAAGALLMGIGFTISLFIAGLALAPPILNAAKLGILGGSAFSAILGSVLLVWLKRRKPVVASRA